MSYYSPYAAAKYVNAELEAAGISKKIPPQMMYNYTVARLKMNKEPFIKYDAKKGIDEKSLNEWTKKYILKKKALESVEI